MHSSRAPILFTQHSDDVIALTTFCGTKATPLGFSMGPWSATVTVPVLPFDSVHWTLWPKSLVLYFAQIVVTYRLQHGPVFVVHVFAIFFTPQPSYFVNDYTATLAKISLDIAYDTAHPHHDDPASSTYIPRAILEPFPRRRQFTLSTWRRSPIQCLPARMNFGSWKPIRMVSRHGAPLNPSWEHSTYLMTPACSALWRVNRGFTMMSISCFEHCRIRSFTSCPSTFLTILRSFRPFRPAGGVLPISLTRSPDILILATNTNHAPNFTYKTSYSTTNHDTANYHYAFSTPSCTASFWSEQQRRHVRF